LDRDTQKHGEKYTAWRVVSDALGCEGGRTFLAFAP